MRYSGSRPLLIALGQELGEVDPARWTTVTSSSSLSSNSTTRLKLFAVEPAHFLPGSSASRMISRCLPEPKVGEICRIARSLRTYSFFFLRVTMIKRRLGDVDPAAADQFLHVAEEERQQQRADVRAVHVGVGHDDDLAVAAFFHVEIVADAAAQGADDRADFLVAEHLDEVGFLDVQDFSAQRQNRLTLESRPCLADPPAESPSTRNSFGVFVGFAAAIGELAGQTDCLRANSCGASARAPCAPLRAPRRRACLSRKSPRASLGFSSRNEPSFSFTADCTNPSTSMFSSLSLVWLQTAARGFSREMIAIKPSRRSSPLGRMSFSSSFARRSE